MIDYLGRLETRGHKVYRLKAITKPNELNDVEDGIRDYFKTHKSRNYVVTDCDIALDSKGDVLDVYSYMLDKFPEANVVGPMLRIDDIPDHYPLKGDIITGRLGMHKGFHSQPMKIRKCGDKEIRYINAPIDTTFGMYRMGSKWSRLQNGIRVYDPYWARHLDWYINPDTMTDDQIYYMNHASKNISTWARIPRKPRPTEFPYGVVEPAKNQENANRVLRDYFNIAGKLGIRTCLAYGTCLGLVRDGGYIPGDNDIDVIATIPMVTPDLADALKGNGFERGMTFTYPTTSNTHFHRDEVLLDIFFREPKGFYKEFDKVKYENKYYPVPHPVGDYLSECYTHWKVKMDEAGKGGV
jgi:hypothetical protein